MSQQKRITILTHNLFFLGGTTRAVTTLANILSDIGYKVEVISVFQGTESPFFKLNSSVKIKTVVNYNKKSLNNIYSLFTRTTYRKTKKLFSPKFIHPDEPGINQFSSHIENRLINTIRNIDCDILISTRASYNLLIANFLDKDITRIAMEHMIFEKHSMDLKRCIIKEYNKFDYIITLTKSDAENYKRFIDPSKLISISNFLPKEYIFDNNTSQKDNIILSAGRFENEKGFDLLIRSINTVKHLLNDWELHIYGDGPEKETYLNLINELNLNHLIKIKPTSNNLDIIMKKSKIYVLPSRFEGFGMVLIEAMGKSNAIISFDCPIGPSEIVINNTGILVPNENVKKLGESIVRLTNDSRLQLTYMQKSYDRAKNYAYKNGIIVWKEFIEKM